MARPPQPIQPAFPPIIVDQRTPFVARSPRLVDAQGKPLEGRTVSLSLVHSAADPRPIHSTLTGYGVDVGDGEYTRAFAARALWLRLALFANRRVALCTQVTGFPPVFTDHLVVWQANSFPTSEA